ncbi:beta-lactamase class A [Actinophytocola algeriensis]|uniref:Beta-lactamase class A n=1 Tax=Actinophytocola algeriensis TaxID=1768010 RepID=A0A7W7Q0Z8_9PSEU|nr:class A beta-lactamase [Actinophytocola algeriensis]MBB4904971.1 beta-lactamase class A [Actinophytocola algeriensis]MBE1476169.1 beta-lactamase class A [Actinophytocola algeriensis]
MAALLPLPGCAEQATPPRSTRPPSPPPSGPPTTTTTVARHDRLAELETAYGARLGVFASGTGGTVEHRADERFAFCSSFKGIAAAAVLHRNPTAHLDTVVTYTEADLLPNATVTPRHVATGMTVRDLCDAAVRHSDGTAGNLLLRDLGGPAELTAFARELGDTVTRMDRTEPHITEATPGDPRDTTSPRAFGLDYRKIVVGDVLPGDKRAFLRDLLARNATEAGARRIRAGVPAGWTVADKTGTGGYGTIVDVGIVWPPSGAPLVVSVMSSKQAEDAEYDQAIIAEATAYVVATLT